MPIFAPDGGPGLVLARGFAVVFLLSVSGTLLFGEVVVRRAFAHMTSDVTAPIERALRRWTWFGLVFAVGGLCAWFAAITADLAGPQTFGDWMDGLWAVLSATDFGHIVVLQILLLAATGVALGWRPSRARWRIALMPGTAASILQVGHGHAYAMAHGLSMLEISEALHLWAAGAWLGGLLPLLFVVLLAPPAAAAMAARWFSPLGKICVVLVALSATVQGVVLVGSLQALRHTAYGWTALLKLGLFGVLLGFAILNRYWLAPELRKPHPNLARRRLIVSLAVQTGFGVLVVLAAALLGQLRPGMSMSMQG